MPANLPPPGKPAHRRAEPVGLQPDLTSVLNSLGDGLLAVDADWRITFHNERAVELLQPGADQPVVVGGDLRTVVPELAGKEVQTKIRKLLRQGKPACQDLFRPARRQWLEIRIFPGPTGHSVLVRDVSRDHPWQEVQVHAEDLLRAIMEGTKDAVFLKNLQGQYIVINPAGAHLLDRETSEVLGRTDMDLWAKPVAEKIAQADREILKGGVIREFHYVDPRPTHARHILSTKGPYHDRHGNLVGIIGIARDITAEEAARDQRQRNEARFRTLVLASSQAVCTTNALGEITEDSPSWRALTGQTFRQMQGLGWVDAVHPEDRQRVLRESRRSLDTGRPFTLEYRLWAADHSYRYISLRAVPVLSEPGDLLEWVMAHSDITEQKNHDRELSDRTRLLTLRTYIAELLTRSDDLRPILQHCTEALVQNLQVELAQIWSNDEKLGLRLESSAGNRNPGFAAPQREVLWVSEKRQPYVTNSAANDAILGEVSWLKEADLNFFAGYPMIVEGKLVGVLAAYANRTLTVNLIQELSGIVEGIGQWILRKHQQQERQRFFELAEQERARAQATQRHFQMLSELVPQLVWSTQPDGCADWFNQRWCEATGLTIEQSLGDGWLQAVHPEDQDRSIATWKNATTRQIPYDIEYRLKTPSGDYRWYISRGLPLKDDSGKIVKWFGTCTDIHDRKIAAEMTRESEARYRGVVESELLPILFFHTDGRLLGGNKLAVKVLGYTQEELQSGTLLWKDITPPEYHAMDGRKMNELKGTGVALPFEKEYICKDGSHIAVMLGCSLLPGYDDRGVAFVLNLEHLRKADRETTRIYRRKLTSKGSGSDA